MKTLKTIIIEVTQACNHACVHCYNYWSDNRAAIHAKDTLTREEILKIIRKICIDFPVENIAISGGEPLLRKDITAIVNDISDLGLNVTVITNGTLLTKNLLKKFPKHITFEMTLFSSNAAIHDSIAGRPGAFKKVINNAISVYNHDCALAIACVLCKKNISDLGRTVELALAIGADGILLNRVNLTSHTLNLGCQLVPFAEELKSSLDSVEEIAKKCGIIIGLSVPVPPCVVDPVNYKNIHFGWCPRGNEMSYYTIGYNGLVRPCNHSSIILGDLRRESLKSIIDMRKTREFWSIFPDECKQCTHPLRDLCKGGCPAAIYECYGSGNRIDPFVEYSRNACGN